MSIYITSDLHFNHPRIIELCNRPFETVEEMNESMIAGWNAMVNDDDDVIVLGDWALEPRKTPGASPVAEIFERLSGRKHIVLGNHDLHDDSTTTQLPWTTQKQYTEIRLDKLRIVMSHYPIEDWNGMYTGSIHLHGHCHGNLKRYVPRRFDVGVDTSDGFNPYPRLITDWVHFAELQDIRSPDGVRSLPGEPTRPRPQT